jgi:hypothetical protein
MKLINFFLVKKAFYVKVFFPKFAFYGLDTYGAGTGIGTVTSKVGTRTVKNSYGSTTLFRMYYIVAR